MKTEVKNTRRAVRGNLLDIVIILLLLAAIFSVGYRYYMSEQSTSDDELRQANVTFRVEDTVPALASSLTHADPIYSSEGGEPIGTLVRHPMAVTSPVLTTAATVLVENGDGSYVRVERPNSDRVDIEGIMGCRGTVDERGVFLLDGITEISPGQILHVHTEKASFALLIVDITLS